MCEVVNELPQVATLITVGTDFAHDEVCARQCYSLGVDAHKDLGNCLDVELITQCDNSDWGFLDSHQLFQSSRNCFVVGFGVIRHILPHWPINIVRPQEFRDVVDPLRLLLQHWCCSRKLFSLRIKTDNDSLSLKVLTHHRLPSNSGTQSSNALLTINQNLLIPSMSAAFNRYLLTLPSDKEPHREPAIQRIHQIANLRTVPYKWSLHFRNRNSVALNPSKQRFDCVLVHGVHAHTDDCPTGSQSLVSFRRTHSLS